MEAPKFSFMVETQQTRSQKGKRESITSTIRSHLAYRQHSRRRLKSGKQLCRRSLVKNSISASNSHAEQVKSDQTSTPPQAVNSKQSITRLDIPQSVPVYSPSESVASEGLSPFALEYLLDEDKLLNFLYQPSLDAGFFPQIYTEPFIQKHLSWCASTESSPMMLAVPVVHTPRKSLDSMACEVGGNMNLDFASA